jgi:hypothetical protein
VYYRSVIVCFSIIYPAIHSDDERRMRLSSHLVLEKPPRPTFGLNSAYCWCTSLPQSNVNGELPQPTPAVVANKSHRPASTGRQSPDSASQSTAIGESSDSIELRDLSPTSASTSHSRAQSHSPPHPPPCQPTLPTPPPPAHCR